MKKLILILALVSLAIAQTPPHDITLAWLDTVNPVGTTYNVYRASGPCVANPAPFVKLTPAAIAVKTYKDSNVVAGLTYCFATTSVSATAESGFSNLAVGTIPSNGPMLAPTSIMPFTNTFGWSDTNTPGATYSVYRASGLCPASVFTKVASGLSVKSFVDSTALAGNYCYAITATAGGVESPQSTPFSVTVIVLPPANFKAVVN